MQAGDFMWALCLPLLVEVTKTREFDISSLI